MTSNEAIAEVIAEIVHLATAPLIAKIAALEVAQSTHEELMAGVELRLASSEQRPMVPGPEGPSGKDGRDGIDGKDGAPGLNGKDGAPGVNGKDGAAGVDGKDGADGLNGKDGAPGLDGKDGAPGVHGKDGADGLHGKDGVGLSDALIDRDGHLILTFSDGHTKDVALVVGQHGAPGAAGKDGGDGVHGKDGLDGLDGKDGAPGLNGKDGADGLHGKDGEPGLGFDDLSAAFDDDKGFVLVFERGEQRKEFALGTPFDTSKAWEAGRRYVKGAGVRCDGGFWLAKKENVNQKPGQSDAWVLSAKRGKDGKDGRDGKHGDSL